MSKTKIKKISVVLLAVLALSVVGCSSGIENNNGEDKASDTGSDSGEEPPLLEQLDYKIVGIDAGAGIMEVAEDAVEDYGLDFIVQTSSDAAMTQTLGDAIENNEPVIVTAWTPHWIFSKYDLKYLEDPKGSFGGSETINTLVRLGLKEEDANAYKILNQFNWDVEDMEKVMSQINEGVDPEKAAGEWIDNNQDKVEEWTQGIKKVDGDEIRLAYVSWDTAIASNNVLGKVLKDIGYDLNLTQVEAGAMWASVASGDADASLCAWLPDTDKRLIAKYKDELEDLGANLTGAKVGLAVPKYVDLKSIEDLAK